MKSTGRGILGGIVATIIMIVLSIIYFVITLFVIKAAASIVFSGSVLDVGMAVLAAAVLTLGSMLGGMYGMRE